MRSFIPLGSILPALVILLGLRAIASGAPFTDVIEQVLPKIVKIYGTGGLSGLEAYQSGILISGDGYVLTSWSYVLDPDYTTAVLHDGRKFEAQFVGSDPELEIAILKIDTTELEFFDVHQAVSVGVGSRILAFSNLFGVATGDEAASVQHGVVSAVTTLQARRGTFQTPFRGNVYVLDAMTNNAGATGGALTDRQGRLVAMLGKELRNNLNNTWLNYAIPITDVASAVTGIIDGTRQSVSRPSDDGQPAEPMTLDILGIVLLPDVLDKTPPYVDEVRFASPAAQVGLAPDDLIVYVNSEVVRSRKDVVRALALIDRGERVRLAVLRQQELLNVELEPNR